MSDGYRLRKSKASTLSDRPARGVISPPPGERSIGSWSTPEGGRHHAAPVQVLEVQVLERGHAHPRLVEGGADQQRLAQRGVEEPLAREDVEHQARVAEAVRAQRLGIGAVQALDGLHAALAGAAVDQLAPAEQGPRHGLEPVVLEPHAGEAHEPERVHHLSAVGDGPAAPPAHAPLAAFPVEERGRAVGAADVERDAEVAEPPVQGPEVEVDDVPPGQDVGIELEDASPQLEQQVLLGGEAPRRRGPAAVQEHLGALGAVVADEGEADRPHRAAGPVGLDVEGQHRQARRGRVRDRGDRGILVDAPHPPAGSPGSLDGDGGVDARIDEQLDRGPARRPRRCGCRPGGGCRAGRARGSAWRPRRGGSGRRPSWCAASSSPRRRRLPGR